jgi:hypothetical protein
MKVALVSDYPLDEYLSYGFQQNWSTPRGIYDSLINNSRTSEVKFYPFPSINDIDNYPFKEILKDIESKLFKPDIIFYMACGPINDSMFSKDFFQESKLVVDLGDEPQTKGFNSQRAMNADVVLTPDRECYNFYRSLGYNTIHTGQWADTKLYKPDENIKIIHSVVSSMKGDRGNIIPHLQKKLGNNFLIETDIEPEKNALLYQSGKIVFQKSRFNEVTRRIFEGMATKKLVITDKLPPQKRLDLFFKEDEEIILYETKKEALQKIKYYLRNEQEREEIAENGYKKVTSYYSNENIINYLL